MKQLNWIRFQDISAVQTDSTRHWYYQMPAKLVAQITIEQNHVIS